MTLQAKHKIAKHPFHVRHIHQKANKYTNNGEAPQKQFSPLVNTSDHINLHTLYSKSLKYDIQRSIHIPINNEWR